MKKRMIILVTGVGTTTGISVIKGLREQNEYEVYIIGTDTNDSNTIAGSYFCDTFYKVPLALDHEYIPKMLDICKNEKVQVLIPIVDVELLVMAGAREQFEDMGIVVVVSDIETIRMCNDKWETFRFFQSYNIPTVATWLVDGINLNKLDYPVFVKPRYGVGSVDSFRVNTMEELDQICSRHNGLIVQEYIRGQEYTTDILMDFNNLVVSVVPRERIEIKSGISYKGRTVYNDKLVQWAVRIADLFRICGPANIQCIVQDDRIAYIDVNPRFSGSLPLTIAAGVNTPWWILKLINGQMIPYTLLGYKEITMARYWAEVFYTNGGSTRLK